jgi:hypothetical protein
MQHCIPYFFNKNKQKRFDCLLQIEGRIRFTNFRMRDLVENPIMDSPIRISRIKSDMSLLNLSASPTHTCAQIKLERSNLLIKIKVSHPTPQKN